MYVCLCKSITDRQIRRAADRGARSLAELSRHLGLATGCGSCATTARQVLDMHLADRRAGTDPAPAAS
jgi:bacterioferritin-associated ferredoxin